MRVLRDRGLTLKRGITTVESLVNGNLQVNRLSWAAAATFSRCARGSGLCVVAFSSRGYDPRHSAGTALNSIVYAGRLHGAGRSCTPITVSRTSTADSRTTRTARTRGCSRPNRFRGTTRPGRTRRPAWSDWRHRTGRTHRRHGCHRICRTTRTPRRYGRNGIHGTNRTGGRPRIRRTSRTQRRTRRNGKRRVNRPQGRNRRDWPVGLGWPGGRDRPVRPGRRDRGCRADWP